jgi:citrate lyase subunit beta/citryl-CoA lyase
MKLRSMLFIPADSEKKLHKGDDVPADALILDLEDSVAPSNKPAARQLAADYLASEIVFMTPEMICVELDRCM